MHLVCSLYVPRITFGDNRRMSSVYLNKVPSSCFKRACYICKDIGNADLAEFGACIRCQEFGCERYSHATCALFKGLLCERTRSSKMTTEYLFYCEIHQKHLKNQQDLKFIPAFTPKSDRKSSNPKRSDHLTKLDSKRFERNDSSGK